MGIEVEFDIDSPQDSHVWILRSVLNGYVYDVEVEGKGEPPPVLPNCCHHTPSMTLCRASGRITLMLVHLL